MPEIMVTKLLPPRTGKDLVERPRLLTTLNRAENNRVILLTAPAGYGKTVLMTQYLAHSGRPFVWYQLDAYDNDPLVFLDYLVTGIRQCYPDFAQKTLCPETLGEAAANPRLAATVLINNLSVIDKQNLVIIFDDYHIIKEVKIHHLLQELCSHLPAGLQIILAGRTPPPFNLSRLYASGELLIINAGALRFNLKEIALFLNKKGIRLPREALLFLDEKTGGWPVTLRFLNGSVVNALAESSLETGEIYAYLASEVFERQSKEIREFLTATAVLEVLTPEECDLLVERADSRQLLSTLEKQQLFLNPLAGKVKAYRYHQLFREFLLDRLGKKRSVLHQRAGRLAQDAQKPDQAVEYMLAAGINPETLTMLKTAGREALRQGRWLTVARWLSRIPEKQLITKPWLCIFQAQVLTYRGQLDEAELWTIRAEKGFDARQEEAGTVESQILRARILRSQGRYNQSIVLLDEVAAKLPSSEAQKRFDLPLERSLCLFLTGRLQEAEKILSKAVEEAKKANDPYLLAHLAEGLGNTYYMQGRYPEAMQSFKQAVKASPSRLLPGYYMQDNIPVLYKEWGQLDRALELAKRNIKLKEDMGLSEALPSAYGQLGCIYAEIGNTGLADKYFRRGIEAARQNNSDQYFYTINRGLLGWVCSMENRWVEARTLAEEALKDAKEQGGLSYPLCELVLGTILAQMKEEERARRLLEKAAATLEQMGVRVPLCYTYKALAWLCEQCGEQEKFQTFAQKYLQLAAKHNYVRSFLPTTYHLLRPILRYGLKAGVEVSFVQRVFVQLGEKAVELLAELAAEPDVKVRKRVIPPLLEIGGEKAAGILNSLHAETGGRETLPKNHLTRTGEANACPLRIQTFGSFRVFFQGQEITATNWRTRKARDLLAYLVHQDKPVSTGQILDDLWPGLTLHKAANAFHSNLYNLRRTLSRFSEKDLILRGTKLYQLQPESFQSDRRQFMEARRRLLKEPLTESVLNQLEEAAALYYGDYLDDLDYVWIIPTQEELKNIYFEIKQRLAVYYLDLHLYPRAVTHLRQLTAANPYSEEPLRLLLQALAGMGDYQGINEQYHAFTKTLSEELGLAPSPELTALYKSFSSQQSKG